MTLWLVRHGPTHAKGMTGWTDLPADLTDAAALARLAAHLPDAPVVSSDLVRASTTADAIAGPRLRLPHDPDLREMHFGEWEGLRHGAIPDQARARRFWETPGDIAPPGGESWHMLATRVTAATDRLTARHPDLIVVCHFGPILALLQRALGVSAPEVMRHTIDPLSVTRIAVQGEVPEINHKP